MKRIAFAVSNDLNYDQRMQKICGSLQSAGYHVTIIGRQKRDSRSLESRAYGQKRLRLIFEKGKLFYLELNIRLFFQLLFVPCDIISAVDLDTILPCLFAAMLRGKKRVYDAHEYFTEVPEVVNRPPIQKIWKWVERFSVPKMDLCYTPTESIAGLFSAQLDKKFYVIRNLPYFQSLNQIQSSTEKYILYQGALNVGRGLEELIRSVQNLPLKLVLAGEGDLSVELRTLVKSLGLDKKIEFKGWVRPEELKKLTTQAFLGYNLLADIGKSYYYSLSNKFFDYMIAGVPSLSPPFPEYEKINRRYNFAILTNLSQENIVKNIGTMLNDREIYNVLRENCQRAAKELNWENEEKKLTLLYNDL